MDTSIKQVTGPNIAFIVDRLDKGESLVISRKEDGIVTFSITKGTGIKQRETTHLDNCLYSTLNREPVAKTWMSLDLSPTPANRLARKNHKKLIHEKAKKNNSAKDIMMGCLELQLAFMDISDASLTSGMRDKYYEFRAGSFVIYTRADKVPLMYKMGESGELIYL